MKKYLFLILILSFLFTLNSCTNSNKYIKETTNFGIKSAKKGYWKEAKFRWEKLVKEDPDDFIALNNLAVCYEVEEDFETAKEFYSRALELQPKNKYIKINLEKVEALLFAKEQDKKQTE
ncbi:tetratricopeptide repeat protein [Candidatus Dependentiae bacterium]|nr:tetratricopeptide repeat protein [Candidatus Dependentiae bacterium]